MAKTTVLSMFANITASADGEAAMDIPEDGELHGVDWDMAAATGFADGDSIQVELSFLSTNQLTTNDARGPISGLSMGVGALGTNGLAGVTANKYTQLGDGIPVAGGERIFLHSAVLGAGTADVHCRIHFIPKKGATARRSSRRR